MKFKIGDLVRVKRDLEGRNQYDGLYFATGMEMFRGLMFIVDRICYDYVLKPIPRKRYPNEVRSNIPYYYFNDAMLEQPYVSELCEFIRKEVQC